MESVLIEQLATILQQRIEKNEPGDSSGFNGLWEAVSHYEPERKSNILAVETAVRELMWTSGVHNLDEEHQTSSFMGLLTSNLTWHYLVSAIGNEMRDFPQISWAHIRKTDESRQGADFGILVRPKSGESTRITLFQAKRARKGKFSVDHVTKTRSSRSNTTFEHQLRYFALPTHKRSANQDLFDGLRRIVRDAPLPKFQAEAFTSTWALGQTSVYALRSWCRYLVWGECPVGGKTPQPMTAPVEEVMARIAPNGLPIQSLELWDNMDLLSSVLCCTINGYISDQPYLEVGDHKLSWLLGSIVELMPNIEMLGFDEEGKGALVNIMSRAGFHPQVQNSALAGTRIEPAPSYKFSLGA